ncbi:hypothetical protein BTO09_11115 [Gilvibacter sp. SZ-19]|nr:hypothetical protein BTO09_11115 [Gilvibacter sp. SZ-19]
MFIYDGSRLTRIDVIRPGEAAVKFFEFEYNDDGSLHQFTFWYSEDNPEYYVYNYDASGRVSLVNIYVSAADLAANRPRFGKFRVYQDDALDFSEEIVESYSTVTGEIQNVTARRVNAFAAQETTLNFGSALNEIPRVILLGDITRLTKDFLDFQFLPLNEDWINPETGDVQTVRSEVEPVFSSDGQLNSLQAKSYSIISDTPPTNDEIYEFTYVEQ